MIIQQTYRKYKAIQVHQVRVTEKDGVWALGCFGRFGLVRGDGHKNTLGDALDNLNNYLNNPQDIKSLTDQGARVEVVKELKKKRHKDREGNQKDFRPSVGITLETCKKKKYQTRTGIDTGPRKGTRILEKEHLGKPIPVLYQNSQAITWIPLEIHKKYYPSVPTVDRLEWEAKNWP